MEQSNNHPPQPVTAEQVHAEFERLLRDRNHMGVRNLLGDVLFQPRNPFQKVRRQPTKWLVALGGVLLLGLLIAYQFHWQ
ncbi:MAG: hypothetical protein IPJ98_00525 [Bryobacterales bacterium]|nr:hypothetical protein [Bryobacterales bacterium]